MCHLVVERLWRMLNDPGSSRTETKPENPELLWTSSLASSILHAAPRTPGRARLEARGVSGLYWHSDMPAHRNVVRWSTGKAGRSALNIRVPDKESDTERLCQRT